ncbi:hypothetical protein P171DRAFT_140400 [Karstenula rhodostoma CBS 690.94]|uniref:Uncharacterized protein n=1 Tax=Karstenula rhodostoma CBS 690.94 TaxID=1392251 RepID=A0A9P4PX19_9PLEO|nr:hypothetical protein P171DRAFT_140400 [Karstenula rhodostoma CBS 690.94]
MTHRRLGIIGCANFVFFPCTLGLLNQSSRFSYLFKLPNTSFASFARQEKQMMLRRRFVNR